MLEPWLQILTGTYSRGVRSGLNAGGTRRECGRDRIAVGRTRHSHHELGGVHYQVDHGTVKILIFKGLSASGVARVVSSFAGMRSWSGESIGPLIIESLGIPLYAWVVNIKDPTCHLWIYTWTTFIKSVAVACAHKISLTYYMILCVGWYVSCSPFHS